MTNKYKETILWESKLGTKYILTRKVKKASVSVVRNNVVIDTYRFNNVALYEHKYLSWANLDCSKGVCDENYKRYEALQKNKKLAIEIIDTTTKIYNSILYIEDFDFNDEYFDIKDLTDVNYGQWNGNLHKYGVLAARKGCISDFFNLAEIVKVYRSHDIIDLDTNKLKELGEIRIIKLFDDMPTERGPELTLIKDLALGYPIESTVKKLKKIDHNKK